MSVVSRSCFANTGRCTREYARCLPSPGALLLLVIGNLAALTVPAKAQPLPDSSSAIASTIPAQPALPYSRPTQAIKRRNYLFDGFGPYPIVGGPPESKDSGVVVDLTVIASCYGLNSSQAGAFAKIVATRPIGLLQGPPGTGKTKFIVALVHFFNTDWRYPYHQALALIGMGRRIEPSRRSERWLLPVRFASAWLSRFQS